MLESPREERDMEMRNHSLPRQYEFFSTTLKGPVIRDLQQAFLRHGRKLEVSISHVRKVVSDFQTNHLY